MAAKTKSSPKPKAKPLFNVRISGQIEADSIEDAYGKLAAHYARMAKAPTTFGKTAHEGGTATTEVLLPGGIDRVTPAEGA